MIDIVDGKLVFTNLHGLALSSPRRGHELDFVFDLWQIHSTKEKNFSAHATDLSFLSLDSNPGFLNK